MDTWRPDDYDVENGWKISLIVIQSHDPDILNKMDFKLVGPNICYRHEE